MNSEEEFVMRERRLSGEYRRVLNKEGEKADEYTVDAHKKMCRAYADFHGELVLMEHWVSLNDTALVKILKKHDKRSSSLSLRSPFLVSVLQQPFYSTEVLTQLVSKVEKRFRTLNAMLVEEAGGVPVAAGAGAGAGAGASERASQPPPLTERSGSDEEEDARVEAMARTKAAMAGWNGLKNSEAVVRPYGDVDAERTPRRGGREARGVGGGRDVHAGEEGQGVSERRVASIDSRGGTGMTDDDIRGTARARDEGRPSL
jgi:hypothetical protein